MSAHALASGDPSTDELISDHPRTSGATFSDVARAAAGSSEPKGRLFDRKKSNFLLLAQVRLWRWQTRTALQNLREELGGAPGLFTLEGLRGSRRLLKQMLPLLVVLGASVACSLVSGDGSSGGGTELALAPIAPELSKPKLVKKLPPSSRKAPWAYVLPFDHGIRMDRSGQGHFRAPRFHGEHNGLDLLAPVGTPVLSPCAGEAMAGVSKSFGRWLHIICPVPDEYMKAGGPRPWASFFFAHLDRTETARNKWVNVRRQQAVGAVGKSGNARGESVQPHLHLEFIVQRNHRNAMDERHLGKDQSEVAAAEYFADTLSKKCMVPHGFSPKSRLLRRARRIDPFVALTCLSAMKPNYQKAPSPLTAHSHAWNQFYVAKSFNVNLGVEDSSMAKR